MSAAGKAFRRWLPVLVIVIGLVIVSALIWMAIKEFAGQDQGRKKRVIQEISLVKPPPPPPPPKVQEPPKPEIKDEIKEPDPSPEPEKQAEAPPPDSGIPEGPAGGMATDIGAGTGAGVIGGGGGGSRFAWYGALVKERIQETVAKNDKLRNADYRVMVNVWVDAGGTVSRAELASSTGDATLDSALRLVLNSLPPLREGAPEDMPQPIKLRITARS